MQPTVAGLRELGHGCRVPKQAGPTWSDSARLLISLSGEVLFKTSEIFFFYKGANKQDKQTNKQTTDEHTDERTNERNETKRHETNKQTNKHTHTRNAGRPWASRPPRIDENIAAYAAMLASGEALG